VSLAPHVLVAVPLTDAGPGGVVPIPTETLHHLRKVLRLVDGAPLSVTDGAGLAVPARLHPGGAELIDVPVARPEPQPRIVLAQALSKGRRAEDAVRIACELGVDRLVPVIAERTQGRPDARAAAALTARWRAVAVAALEQSRGVQLADVGAPVEGPAAVPASAEGADALLLLAVPGADDLPAVVRASLDVQVPDEVVVGVGPEGGWSPREVAAAVAAGWITVGLGPTVLRTEHAGPAAVAVVAALAGRWAAPCGATLAPRPSRSTDAL